MSASKTINFVCGACFHWAHQESGTGPVTIGEARRGICYGMPPTAQAIVDNKHMRVAAQTNLRPVLPETERACGMFLPEHAMNTGANDPNVN